MCGARIGRISNVVPKCVVPNMWCPNMWCEYLSIVEYKCSFYCRAKYVVPKCVVPKCVVPVGAFVAMWCQLEPVISSDFPEISRDLGNSRDLMTSQRSKGQGQGQGRLI